jgi:hypothetical protein
MCIRLQWRCPRNIVLALRTVQLALVCPLVYGACTTPTVADGATGHAARLAPSSGRCRAVPMSLCRRVRLSLCGVVCSCCGRPLAAGD